ncbi:AsmA-like C-terminal region-containing protein [Rhodovulum imhoffii]|nr:AsmA-like C-terminal region-containing protein [Rhodovulum imhoffii]
MPPPGRFGLWMLLSLAMLAGVAGLVGLGLTGRVVSLPGAVVAQVESRLNAGLRPVSLRLGEVDLYVSRTLQPRAWLRDVQVRDGVGRIVARLPELSVRLSPAALLTGRVRPSEVALRGADINLRRAPDGSFDLALGTVGAPVSAAPNLNGMLDQIDGAFEHPFLARLDRLSIEKLHIGYEDARAGRAWQVQDGLLALEAGQTVSLQVFFSLLGEAGTPAEFAFTFSTGRGSPASRMAASFSNVPAADIATQSPALAYLAVLEAPISGALRTRVDTEGALGPLSAALEIGAGALKPAEGIPPIGFNSARAYFSYTPENGRIGFDRISVDSEALRLSAGGKAYVPETAGGWPSALVAQLRFDAVDISPGKWFDAPVHLSGGALDMKLDLDPFSVTVGQAVLEDGGQNYHARGRIGASETGWSFGADIGLDRIRAARLLELWPVSAAPGLRGWLARNILAGEAFDVKAALRHDPGQPWRVSLSHEVRGGRVRFLPEMPPIEDGHGYGSISERGYTIVMDRGHVTAADGSKVNLAGSVFRVPDVLQRPARAEMGLRAEGTIPAVLSVLDNPPLSLMARSGRSPDLASGRAEARARIFLPLMRGLSPAKISYDVSGTLRGVRSDVLIAGRSLTASALNLQAQNGEIQISGAPQLDGVPLRVRWRQQTGPDAPPATVTGQIELSPRFAQAFGINLGRGAVSGAGWGSIDVTLPKNGVPSFSLRSDLRGVGLRLAGLGWSKAPDRAADMRVSGRLGDVPVIDRLSLDAPGLKAEGRVDLARGGGLSRASFSRVRLGAWLDASAQVRPGPGAPEIALTGGTLDIRHLPKRGSGGGGKGGPVSVRLDRIIVREGLALTGVSGQLQGGALRGRLSGRVNGKAPLTVTLAPAANGTGVRLRSEDAGAVLQAAGLFARARGGQMEIALTPTPRTGSYDGRLRITDTQVRGTSLLAELLSAISVVGLIDLLNGDGLSFSQVDADFRLTPKALQVSQGSAVGPSMGLSVAGVYDFSRRKLDMQGVVSPIYLVNSIGSVLTRRGEGLFGINYRLSGNPSRPQVQINPLSILTPGMFRDLFRRPPPELPE